LLFNRLATRFPSTNIERLKAFQMKQSPAKKSGSHIRWSKLNRSSVHGAKE